MKEKSYVIATPSFISSQKDYQVRAYVQTSKQKSYGIRLTVAMPFLNNERDYAVKVSAFSRLQARMEDHILQVSERIKTVDTVLSRYILADERRKEKGTLLYGQDSFFDRHNIKSSSELSYDYFSRMGTNVSTIVDLLNGLRKNEQQAHIYNIDTTERIINIAIDIAKYSDFVNLSDKEIDILEQYKSAIINRDNIRASVNEFQDALNDRGQIPISQYDYFIAAPNIEYNSEILQDENAVRLLSILHGQGFVSSIQDAVRKSEQLAQELKSEAFDIIERILLTTIEEFSWFDGQGILSYMPELIMSSRVNSTVQISQDEYIPYDLMTNTFYSQSETLDIYELRRELESALKDINLFSLNRLYNTVSPELYSHSVIRPILESGITSIDDSLYTEYFRDAELQSVDTSSRIENELSALALEQINIELIRQFEFDSIEIDGSIRRRSIIDSRGYDIDESSRHLSLIDSSYDNNINLAERYLYGLESFIPDMYTGDVALSVYQSVLPELSLSDANHEYDSLYYQDLTETTKLEKVLEGRYQEFHSFEDQGKLTYLHEFDLGGKSIHEFDTYYPVQPDEFSKNRLFNAQQEPSFLLYDRVEKILDLTFNSYLLGDRIEKTFLLEYVYPEYSNRIPLELQSRLYDIKDSERIEHSYLSSIENIDVSERVKLIHNAIVDQVIGEAELREKLLASLLLESVHNVINNRPEYDSAVIYPYESMFNQRDFHSDISSIDESLSLHDDYMMEIISDIQEFERELNGYESSMSEIIQSIYKFKEYYSNGLEEFTNFGKSIYDTYFHTFDNASKLANDDLYVYMSDFIDSINSQREYIDSILDENYSANNAKSVKYADMFESYLTSENTNIFHSVLSSYLLSEYKSSEVISDILHEYSATREQEKWVELNEITGSERFTLNLKSEITGIYDYAEIKRILSSLSDTFNLFTRENEFYATHNGMDLFSRNDTVDLFIDTFDLFNKLNVLASHIEQLSDFNRKDEFIAHIPEIDWFTTIERHMDIIDIINVDRNMVYNSFIEEFTDFFPPPKQEYIWLWHSRPYWWNSWTWKKTR